MQVGSLAAICLQKDDTPFGFSPIIVIVKLYNLCFGMLQQKKRMNSRTMLLQRSQLYLAKKGKEPDHLLDLVRKCRRTEQNECPNLEEDKQQLKRKMMQKRIDAILKNAPSKAQVSEPVPFVKKKWISPLMQKAENQVFEGLGQAPPKKKDAKLDDREGMQKVVKVLDLNRRLKYFGEYLQVELGRPQKVRVAHISDCELRMSFLARRFQQLERVTTKPKLCIFNYPLHQKITFVNYLQNDQFFQNIMRKDDPELVRILIETLMEGGSFTLTSYMRFYNIFVWQSADRREQIEFVVKLLMKESNQRPICEIGSTIDLICRKIHLENFNKSLENFNEVMKKLIFGDDYEFASRKEYYLTRKALVESMHLNEECISIFINIFYSA